MSADLTLPGDIPGLLRRGSPVVNRASFHAVVVRWLHNDWAVSTDRGMAGLSNVALDLTDPTGRAHAAWWALPLYDDHPECGDWWYIQRAAFGADMTDEQIATLRDLCLRLRLRLAGREDDEG